MLDELTHAVQCRDTNPRFAPVWHSKLVGTINDVIANSNVSDGLQVGICGMCFALAHIMVNITPSLEQALSGADQFHEDLVAGIKNLWMQQQSTEKH